MKYYKNLFTLNILFWALVLVSPMGCGGSDGSNTDESGPIADGSSTNGGETRDFDISIRLNESDNPSGLILGDEDALDSIAAVSLFSQVTRVSLEVLINGTVLSTTDLARSSSNPLIYEGRIRIPVEAEAELHAIAVDASERLLFEGRLRGLRAAEFGTPAIQIVMQRQIPVEVVPPPNTPPIIHGTIVSRASLAYGATTTMTVDAQDPQRDALSYLWEVIEGPEGATLTGWLADERGQGATFTAPRSTGIFRIRITVSDPSGANASREVSVYVSETGRDGTPDTGITLSDFPDCVSWYVTGMYSSSSSGIRGNCEGPGRASSLQFTSTVPHRLTFNPRFFYNGTRISREYTATELFNMGFRFAWSDTCNGNNFISLDASQNEVLSSESSLFVPTFIKNGLENEACQIYLRITNPGGLIQNYQSVLSFSDLGNNRSDPMNCDRDPATTQPKARFICPSTMTGVPQIIQLDVCDGQSDISTLSILGDQWSWRRNSAGKTFFSKDRIGDLYYESGISPVSGPGGSYRFLFIPYDLTYANRLTSAQLSMVDVDGYFSTYTMPRADLIRPSIVQLKTTVSDRAGNESYENVTCTFTVDPSMSLDIPTDYFTRPR